MSMRVATRGITTRAQEFDAVDELPGSTCEDDAVDPGVGCQPRKARADEGQVRLSRREVTHRCEAKPRRVLKDGRAVVSQGFTQDPFEEEARQRKLQERVRELASRRQ
jgi:hypothetical protein